MSRGPQRRVVVTGLGVLCALGHDVPAFWAALIAGEIGARRIEVDGFGSVNAFPVGDIDADGAFGRREARRMDRAGQLAAMAAGQALADAGDLGLARERIGLAMGTAHGGAMTLDASYRVLAERGAERLSPLTIPLSLPNSPASATARAHALRGPSVVACSACAAGSDAIGIAAGIVAAGRADAMVAGGAEAPLAAMIVAGYARMGALSTSDVAPHEACRPFDAGRDGFVMGEGAGVLLLEEREHALARSARIYAELAGYGTSCDAAHLADPDATGAGPATAIRIALEDAGIGAESVGYVSAHATSTPAGDVAEGRALTLAGLVKAPVSATKAMHGHALGAAGGIEAVAATLAIAEGMLPPSVNLDDPEPELDLNHVGPVGVPASVDAALSNSFGFGGHNACLVLTRPDLR